MNNPTPIANPVSNREWFAMYVQEKRYEAVHAVTGLAQLYRERYGSNPTVVLVGRETDTHERRDGIIVRLAKEHEPKVKPGEFYAEVNEVQHKEANRRI